MLAEQRDDIDNPLIWPILSVLEASPQSWKVHYLMAELQKNTIMDHLDDDPQLDLFKRNFLIMNALYQLQEMLLPQQWLQVESMDIRLMWRGAGSGLCNTKSTATTHCVATTWTGAITMPNWRMCVNCFLLSGNATSNMWDIAVKPRWKDAMRFQPGTF